MLPQPERNMLVWRAADIKTVRVRKDRRVTIGRGVPQQHPLARAERLPVQHGVACDDARHVHHGRGPAQDLLDRRRQERGIGGKPGALGRCSQRASMPPEIALRVVSLPARMSR